MFDPDRRRLPATGDGAVRPEAVPAWEAGAAPAADGASAAQVASLRAMLAASDPTLADTLAEIVRRSAAVLDRADCVCLTVRHLDGSREVTASTSVGRSVEELQQRLREGPSVAAADTGRRMSSNDLSAERRWPRLAAALGGQDLCSALSLPLLASRGLVGTLSAYSFTPAAFDAETVRAGIGLAAPTAAAVADALVADRVRRLAEELELSADDRAVVAEAVAVLCEEPGVDRDEALAVLRLLSRTDQADLLGAARAVLADRDPAGPSPGGAVAPR